MRDNDITLLGAISRKANEIITQLEMLKSRGGIDPRRVDSIKRSQQQIALDLAALNEPVRPIGPQWPN